MIQNLKGRVLKLNFHWSEKELVSWITLFYQCKIQKNQFWRFMFIKEKQCLFLEWPLFYQFKNQLKLYFHWREKRAYFVNDTFILMQKSEATVLKLHFHQREKESASWLFFTDARIKRMSFEVPFPLKRKGPVSWMRDFSPWKSQKDQSWSCIFIEKKRACFLNDTFSDDALFFSDESGGRLA